MACGIFELALLLGGAGVTGGVSAGGFGGSNMEVEDAPARLVAKAAAYCFRLAGSEIVL